MAVLIMARPHKNPRTAVYEFRRAVPKDLRPYASGEPAEPRHEFKRSLKTKDHREAVRRYPDAAALCDGYFAELRSRRDKAAITTPYDRQVGGAASTHLEGVFTRGDLAALAADLGDNIMAVHPIPPEEAFALNLSAPPGGTWGGPKEPWRGHLHILIRTALDRKPATESSTVTGPAEAFLQGRGVKISADDWATFCEFARDAITDAYATLQRRYRGEELGTSFRQRYGGLLASASSLTTTNAPRVPFSNLIEGWKRERSPRKGSVLEFTAAIEEFCEFIGHDDAARATADDVVRWKDKLLTDGKLAAKTIREKRLAALKVVLEWGKANRKLAANVAQGVTVSGKAAPRGRSKGFTDAEARTILRAALDVPTPIKPRTREAARRWIPWLCCYTGARVTEIAQLRGSDFGQEQGAHYMMITPDAGIVSNCLTTVTLFVTA